MNLSPACAVPSASRRSRLASMSAGGSPGSFPMEKVRRLRARAFASLLSRFGDGSGGGGMGRTPSVDVAVMRRHQPAGWRRGVVFELCEALLEFLRRQRPHVDVDHLGDVGGLRRRELA